LYKCFLEYVRLCEKYGFNKNEKILTLKEKPKIEIKIGESNYQKYEREMYEKQQKERF